METDGDKFVMPYELVLEHILRYLDWKRATIEEKISTLRFVMGVVARDVEGYYHARQYRRDGESFPSVQDFFPVLCVAEKTGHTSGLLLRDKFVVFFDDNTSKPIQMLVNLERYGSAHSPNPASGYFFPELNLVFLDDKRFLGIMAGERNEKCAVDVDVFSVKSTIGKLEVVNLKHDWSYNGQKKRVLDYRFAFLYDLYLEITKLEEVKEKCATKEQGI